MNTMIIMAWESWDDNSGVMCRAFPGMMWIW